MDYETAVDYFRRCGYGFDGDNTLPAIAELKQDYAKHDAAKKSLWAKYHEIRNGDKEISNAWGNVRAILNLDNDKEFAPQKFEMPAQNLHQKQFEIPAQNLHQPKSEITLDDLEQYENEIHQPQKSSEIAREIVPSKTEPRISPPQPQQNIPAPKPKIRKRSGLSL